MVVHVEPDPDVDTDGDHDDSVDALNDARPLCVSVAPDVAVNDGEITSVTEGVDVTDGVCVDVIVCELVRELDGVCEGDCDGVPEIEGDCV